MIVFSKTSCLWREQKGMVLVLALLMLAAISIIGIAALNTSDTEMKIAQNEKQLARQFYDAESVLVATLEDRTAWLTESFLAAGETGAYYTSAVDFDGDGSNDGTVELRCIESSNTPIGSLSNAANDLPSQPHISSSPPGSGFSLKHFEARRYGITATSSTGNTRIQAGLYKVFNKY
ncbi:MAG: hypothetical protein JRJ12_09160 [Deltaproteobacteria bacterium]|nr:hypothetical protein [Deltaproteobacteria bacterium]MBW2070407.1 hypothetical protein [Deltaproteobacteria bacterium]